LVEAKKHFSKTNCPAYDMASNLLTGAAIRQDYLETALEWISNGDVEKYMSENQHAPDASELWLYFQSVINWVRAIFPKYRKEMKGLPFGTLYNQLKDRHFDFKKLEEEIGGLMLDDEVTKKSGIYSYVLTHNSKYLNLRSFTERQKREAYEKQQGVCPKCGEHFEIEEMEADHIVPWVDGGKTISENCQLLCRMDNRLKSNK
jgi:hypothetical protein